MKSPPSSPAARTIRLTLSAATQREAQMPTLGVMVETQQPIQ
jgi:hypothetical protein